MKSTLIVILLITLAVLLSQFNLALKDNSLIVRYVQPFFYETLESGLDIVRSDDAPVSAQSSGGSGENQDFEIAELR